MSSRASATPEFQTVRDALERLSTNTSVEMTAHDAEQLSGLRSVLRPNTQIFVSHLPKQTWQQTISAAVAVRNAGFEPVPHLPARKLTSESEFDSVVATLSSTARVQSVLLIGGDVDISAGPFDSALAALRTGLLSRHGIRNVAFGAYPEGNPKIDPAQIRDIEVAKVHEAHKQGLVPTLVTQFCFEAAPILEWAQQLRQRGVDCEFRIGLAGPARITTLAKFALRCGIGASVRALRGQLGSIGKLVGEHGPQDVVMALAQACRSQPELLQGLHLYSFGGLAGTSQWLHDLQHGKFSERKPS